MSFQKIQNARDELLKDIQLYNELLNLRFMVSVDMDNLRKFARKNVELAADEYDAQCRNAGIDPTNLQP